MWCFVSECPSVVREYRVPKKATGQLLLDKVCEDLGLVEKDYFGLRYRSKKGELLWLNLRNTLVHQLHGKSPHRLSIQVKFFVSPAELQQSITRHIYYLTIKNRFLLGHYVVTDEEKHQLLALLCQAELGDAEHVLPNQYHTVLPELEDQDLPAIMEAHRSLTVTQSAVSHAETQFVARVAELPGYGVEYFSAETNDRSNVVIGVCSVGLQILTQDRVLIHSIKFEDISKVSYHQNRFSVHYYKSTAGTNVDDMVTALKFRLKSRKVAQALFRSFTECHTFFRCENVERVVRTQHSHTGVGSLIVLFKPETQTGKSYRFDVCRTRRQAYDVAWRKLHPGCCNSHTENRLSLEFNPRESLMEGGTEDMNLLFHSSYSQELQLGRSSCIGEVQIRTPSKIQKAEDESSEDSLRDGLETYQCKLSDRPNSGHNSRGSVDIELLATLQDQLSNIQDSRLCQVCLEDEMSTVFCPCGHMICCEGCSKECTKCPICRAEVTYVQRVFFS